MLGFVDVRVPVTTISGKRNTVEYVLYLNLPLIYQ